MIQSPNKWDLGLRARGVILLGAGNPIVLCAVDWIGIANEAMTPLPGAGAGSGTTADRVAVHTLHQHDAPDCDFSAETILLQAGVRPRQFEGTFQRQVIPIWKFQAPRGAGAGGDDYPSELWPEPGGNVPRTVRVMGLDGKVRGVRLHGLSDPELRAAPEGTIDSHRLADRILA